MSNSSELLSTGSARVAVVLSGWPRLSEVFALNEVLALDRAGLLAGVFALKPGDTALVHPAAAELAPVVELVPDGDAWTQAAYVAERLRDRGVTGVHGYFAHRPAEVAAEAAALLGVPYGFSVHALDVRKVPAAQLAERAAKAAIVIACNHDAAAAIAATGTQPVLVRHGVDLAAFAVAPSPQSEPVRLLAVGRLVEKKGFEFLLAALAKLDRPFQLRLVGDGALRDRLVVAITAHGLTGCVELVGRVTHETLPGEYAAADIVVVPSVVDSTGDRDGLPNVILEAMATGRPVVASDVAAIATAVRDRVTGMLVPARDPDALAAALRGLIDAPDVRERLGAAARAMVEQEFGLAPCTTEFCRTLGATYV